jgi:hypothetical protein
MTCIECSVIVKDENKRLVNKNLLYDPLTLDIEDPMVKQLVRETMDQFKIDAHSERPSIVIKTSMVVQS